MGIKEFKYKIIKNFLSKEEINLAKNYFIMKQRSNFLSFDESQASKTCDSYWYGDPLTESFLLNKLKIMEKETGLQLNPTYGFARMYTYLATLPKHKDRPECEVSVTVMVGSSGEEWPIYMDGTELHLKPGDAAIYLGCDVKHWREEFLGDWHSQFFLHYVDKNGPHKDRIADGRSSWGRPVDWGIEI
jgi:hypothetical protein